MNWPALVQMNGPLLQFLCSVYLEKNSKNFTVDFSYYFWIYYKISWILVEYFEFDNFWSILSNCIESNNKNWVRLIIYSFYVFLANKVIYGGNEYSWIFYWAFSLINEKEEDKYTIWELVYEFWINYGIYKENTKFSKLNSFYLVQWLIWGGILSIMDL